MPFWIVRTHATTAQYDLTASRLLHHFRTGIAENDSGYVLGAALRTLGIHSFCIHKICGFVESNWQFFLAGLPVGEADVCGADA